MDALKWLWNYLKKYRWSISLYLFLSVIFISATFVNPLILGQLVGEVSTGNATLSLLFRLGVIVFVATAIKEIIMYIRSLVYQNVAQSIIREIRHNLYQKLQSLDCHFFDTTPTGDLMSRFTMDSDAVRAMLDTTIPTIANQICFIVIGIIIMSPV